MVRKLKSLPFVTGVEHVQEEKKYIIHIHGYGDFTMPDHYNEIQAETIYREHLRRYMASQVEYHKHMERCFSIMLKRTENPGIIGY